MELAQYEFAFMDSQKPIQRPPTGGVISTSDNTLSEADRAFHDWYRFVLSFPPHLVRDYIRNFGLNEGSTLLDPFCGTGTTIVEARLNGIKAIGLEANPFPSFAATVKSRWEIDATEVEALANEVAEVTRTELLDQGIDDQALIHDPKAPLMTLEPHAMRALIKNSISPLPLHKTLVLLRQLNRHREAPAYPYCVLALGTALVGSIGNLRFGPEVGLGKIKPDVPVVGTWLHQVKKMVYDLRNVKVGSHPRAEVHLSDARQVSCVVAPESIDAVITSPPYPNEKDYTRTTRLESVVLGFIKDMAELRQFKKTLLRSNTRGVYVSDDDDRWIADFPNIQALAERIETRRKELKKTSGFERMYARVTQLYFGGMARHLEQLSGVLRPGAQLAYVVGDQASYLRVMIRTGQLLAEVAETLGYTVERIDLFRTRFATATQQELREEVVVLSWHGPKR